MTEPGGLQASSSLIHILSSPPILQDNSEMQMSTCFHHSLMHHLRNALSDFGEEWECIDPIPIQKADSIKFDIVPDKDQAEVGKTPRSDWLIFPDLIRATAWLQNYENALHREVHHHLCLGSDTHHTVLEADLAGAILPNPQKLQSS